MGIETTQNKPKLVLIRGLPGSGKSTLAKSMAGYRHFEADHFFTDENGVYRFEGTSLGIAHQVCQDDTYQALEEGFNVVVSNTFSRLWEMYPYFDMAKEFGIKPQVVECRGSFGNIHNVPTYLIENMKERWEEYYGD